MASKDLSDQLKDLTLESVIPQNKELGYGAYGKVFIVDYLGLSCAAKEIHSLLLHGVSAEDKKAIKDGFIRECYHSSLIRHPNIVQFMGVYYTERSDLPIMVMELMDTSLTSFIENKQSKIAVETKFSILHDVSLGLSRGVRHFKKIVYEISKSFDFIEITLISGDFTDFIEITLIVKSRKCLHTTSANSDIFATCTCHVSLHECSREDV